MLFLLVSNTSYCVHPAAAKDKVKIRSVMQFSVEWILCLYPKLIRATGAHPRQALLDPAQRSTVSVGRWFEQKNTNYHGRSCCKKPDNDRNPVFRALSRRFSPQSHLGWGICRANRNPEFRKCGWIILCNFGILLQYSGTRDNYSGKPYTFFVF